MEVIRVNKVLVMLANGFEEVEALTVVDYLRRTGIEVKMVSTEKDLQVEGSHGIKVIGDLMIDEIKDPLNYRGRLKGDRSDQDSCGGRKDDSLNMCRTYCALQGRSD
jgi:hypothetical protein